MSHTDLDFALKFVHVIAALMFLLAHGASATIAFRLRREKDHARIGALLEASSSTLPFMGIPWVLLVITGIAGAALHSWLGTGWFLASVVVFLFVTFSMTPLTSPYSMSRAALGLKTPMSSKKLRERFSKFKPEDVERLLSQARPFLMAAIGIGGTALLVYLMMYKPF